MRPFVLFAAVFVVLGSAAGCAPNISPDSYSVGSVGQVSRTVRGVIVSVRDVHVQGTQSGVGAQSGALIGGAGGSNVGGGQGSDAFAGAVAGAVVGGVIGAAIEESATQQPGVEYIVETTNGALITVVQGVENRMSAGDRVLVIYGQRSRVIPDPSQ